MKACLKINGEDFYTVHHELGHNYYQRAYSDQPYIFKGGANDGFHEAIGDFAGLSALTPTYLNQIGVLDKVPGRDGEIPFLLRMALDKIAFLPFALLVDKWRWQVFDGEVAPEKYNDAWWALRNKYQGVQPPGPRPADAFDPAAKFHVADSTPYTRYFLAYIYEFQFHRAACRQAGWTGPLHRCSVYGQKAVGEKFNRMLQMGQSKPWPDAMETFTGQRTGDASAIIEYFAPLNAWLTEQNRRGQKPAAGRARTALHQRPDHGRQQPLPARPESASGQGRHFPAPGTSPAPRPPAPAKTAARSARHEVRRGQAARVGAWAPSIQARPICAALGLEAECSRIRKPSSGASPTAAVTGDQGAGPGRRRRSGAARVSGGQDAPAPRMVPGRPLR